VFLPFIFSLFGHNLRLRRIENDEIQNDKNILAISSVLWECSLQHDTLFSSTLRILIIKLKTIK
jgi:hypothetical protein